MRKLFLLLTLCIFSSSALAEVVTFQPLFVGSNRSHHVIKASIVGANTKTLVGNKIMNSQGNLLPNDIYREIKMSKNGSYFPTNKAFIVENGVIKKNVGGIQAKLSVLSARVKEDVGKLKNKISKNKKSKTKHLALLLN